MFVKLETCRDKEAALMAEIFWIEHFKWRGARLLNSQGFSGYAAREGERQRLEQGVGQMARGAQRDGEQCPSPVIGTLGCEIRRSATH
jgi:hypothetical protein